MSNVLNKTDFSSPLGGRGRFIELLSPAKNLECGIAAINHGADAVYIGASKFGARAAAGNSIQDIESLVNYAHRFRAKVFVALNTVLTDRQLPDAEKLIHQIYSAGADALIIQDMGILKMNLPPIALHASTQTDNRTAEKVRFLQNTGFSRVVLARELSLKQISDISAKTEVELEAFVHGALCVSYSGQCYISQAMCGRSANRGECAQYCRLPYNLVDVDGNVITKNKHLLSLKDLDLSEHLQDMIDAGITSLKIEGRLKDSDYVKNITAFYRKKLDTILEGNSEYKKASAGRTTFFFEPDPDKSFRRGSTDYFFNERHKGIFTPETPKSLGEEIGRITFIGKNFFEVENGNKLNNGDGLCFLNSKAELVGFRLNKTEIYQQGNRAGVKCFPLTLPEIITGTLLYRNQNQVFDKILAGKTSERKLPIVIEFCEIDTGFSLKAMDKDGISAEILIDAEKQPAQKPDAVYENIRNQLSKLGNTIYEASEVKIYIHQPWFFAASQLGEWKRGLIEKLENIRQSAYKTELRKQAEKAFFPQKALTYLGNITNSLAESFYREHGVEYIQLGFEVKAQKGVPLMFTRHCIKYEMGRCPREGGKSDFKEPLFLTHKGQKYELKFDCKKCEMQVLKV